MDTPHTHTHAHTHAHTHTHTHLGELKMINELDEAITELFCCPEDWVLQLKKSNQGNSN